MDGGLDGSRRKPKKKKADVNIYDIYEPFDLEKGHFTMQDHEIKMTDLPERLVEEAVYISVGCAVAEDVNL